MVLSIETMTSNMVEIRVFQHISEAHGDLVYPLVNIQKTYGKSPFFMGKLTQHGHFQ
jgi:hypothetical protein